MKTPDIRLIPLAIGIGFIGLILTASQGATVTPTSPTAVAAQSGDSAVQLSANSKL